MRDEEEEPNWFAQWEAQLPPPEELMPLSQSLITPDLALAFDIAPPSHSHSPSPSAPCLYPPPSSSLAGAGDAAESDNAGGGGAGSGEEPARTLKRPRLVWTPQLHKRFVDAVAHLGIKNAVPKTIMQLMSVDGLTRENVASHLQKYRLYLKRMQGLSSSAGPGGAPAPGPMSAAEAAEHHLFAAGPLPHHFLHRAHTGAAPAQDHYQPYVTLPSLHQHQQQQIATATAAAAQYYNPRHFGGQFDHGFLSRQHATANHPIIGAATAAAPAANYGDELELGSGGGGGGGGGRTILTLFPTGDD